MKTRWLLGKTRSDLNFPRSHLVFPRSDLVFAGRRRNVTLPALALTRRCATARSIRPAPLMPNRLAPSRNGARRRAGQSAARREPPARMAGPHAPWHYGPPRAQHKKTAARITRTAAPYFPSPASRGRGSLFSKKTREWLLLARRPQKRTSLFTNCITPLRSNATQAT